jgi:hypothetical protein
MSGKGSAPRPIPDRKSYEENYDAIFRKNPEPKPKAQLMREMRKKRKAAGLTELRVWVTDEQAVEINLILNK